jgi:hypothetical protein
MLINISNHSTQHWSEAQKNEAFRLFGSITNMEFPAIDPEVDTKAVEKLADEYLQQIKRLQYSFEAGLSVFLQDIPESEDESTPRCFVVHLMGELTFCFALAAKLQQNNIRCVLSTTERVALEQEGMKLSQFNFVKFRDYPNIQNE